MPKERRDDTRPNLPRRNEPRVEIRRLRAVIDVNDPVQVEEWEREWGAAWRARQEAERRDDRPSG